MPTRRAIRLKAFEGLHIWLNPERPRLVFVELEQFHVIRDTEFDESIVETTITLSNDEISEQNWQRL